MIIEKRSVYLQPKRENNQFLISYACGLYVL